MSDRLNYLYPGVPYNEDKNPEYRDPQKIKEFLEYERDHLCGLSTEVLVSLWKQDLIDPKIDQEGGFVDRIEDGKVYFKANWNDSSERCQPGIPLSQISSAKFIGGF